MVTQSAHDLPTRIILLEHKYDELQTYLREVMMAIDRLSKSNTGQHDVLRNGIKVNTDILTDIRGEMRGKKVQKDDDRAKTNTIVIISSLLVAAIGVLVAVMVFITH